MKNVEKETLSILQEECAEVIQAISKIQRFGIDESHPVTKIKNREHLEEEIGDLQCMISILVELGIVNEENLMKAESKKFDKLKKWSNIFNEA